MSKVGILYICTGKYNIFWKGFYRTCKKKFLKDSEKYFFVWTDDRKILKNKNTDILVYEQDTEAWPFPTLKRFDYFLRAEKELRKMDYILFMNANLRVETEIYEKDILPSGEEKLFVTIHPGYFDKHPDEYPYDRNPECGAYIDQGEGEHYYAGGFNGGRTEDYLDYCKKMSDAVSNDLKKDTIALWHDESYLNRYMHDYRLPYKVLSPEYLYPEGWDIPFDKKILILDKKKIGGHDFLRGNTNGCKYSFCDLMKFFLKRLKIG